MNISGPEAENEISGGKHISNITVDAGQPRLITDTGVAVLGNFIGNNLAGDSWNWRFASGVNIRNHNPIRIVESGAEFLAQCSRSGIPMRLKHGQDTFPAGPARSRDGGANLRRMMGVIINQQKAITLILNFESPPGVLKFSQRFSDFFKWNTQFRRKRDDTDRVLHVVTARHIQARLTELPALAINAKNGCEIFERDVLSLVIRALA